MSSGELNIDDLYAEVADLARDQGVADKETWVELVEEVVEGHLDLGEIDMETDTEAMKEVLRTKWEEYKEEAAAEGLTDIEEEDEKIVTLDGAEEKEEEEELI